MMKYTMTFPFEGYMITGVYYPATPDVSYFRNGDPGYPGDDAEFTVVSITKNGFNIPLEVFFPNEEDDIAYTQLYDAIALKANEYDVEQQRLNDEGDAKLQAEMDALPPYIPTLEED